MSDISKWLNEINFTSTSGKANKVRALIYGGPGVGKTRFAATAPKPLFFDADKGLSTVNRMGIEVPYVTLERGEKVFKKIMDILKESKDPESEFFKKHKIQTIVFDSLTALAEMVLLEAMQYPIGGGTPKNPNTAKPDWDDYNAVLNRTKYIMKYCQDLGYNIIVICGEKLEKDEITGTFVGEPNIVGSYRRVAAHDFDEMYYMESKETREGTEYYLYATKHRYYNAKSRLGVESFVKDPSFEKVFKNILE